MIESIRHPSGPSIRAVQGGLTQLVVIVVPCHMTGWSSKHTVLGRPILVSGGNIWKGTRLSTQQPSARSIRAEHGGLTQLDVIGIPCQMNGSFRAHKVLNGPSSVGIGGADTVIQA